MPSYEPIKKVAVARDNLATTIGLLELFRSIPEKADELELKLNDDRELKNIYKEIRRLVALRNKAFSKGLQYTSDSSSNTAAIYSESFEALQRVATSLEERVWANICDSIILAQGDPATLVRTLEVIEMEDRERVKIFSRDLVKSSQESNVQKENRTMRERCFIKLEEEMLRKFESFIDNKNLELPEILKKADSLIEDLKDINDYVVKCYPPEYKIFEFFEKRYQVWLHSRLMDAIGNPSILPPGDILLTVKWIQNYKRKMQDLAADLNAASELESVSETLMESYVTQSKGTMLEWVANLIKRERTSEPVLDEATGVYSTNATQDLFMLTINQQVDIAFRQLRGKNFVNVMKTCVDVLSTFQEQFSQFILDPNAVKTEEYLAAVVNTLHDCAEETSRLKQSCYTFLEKDSGEEMAAAFDEVVDDVITGFVKISNLSAQLLAANIMKTISTVMDKAFNPQWITQDTWCEEAVITLQDYFGDYSKWLASEYYFGRVVKDVAHDIVSTYIQKLIYIKPASPENLPDQVAIRVQSDIEHLEGYLCSESFDEIVPAKVFHEEFDSIRQILEILRAEETFMSVYFDSLIARFGGTESQKLFTELLNMRSDIDRSSKRDLIDRFKEKVVIMSVSQGNGNESDQLQILHESNPYEGKSLFAAFLETFT